MIATQRITLVPLTLAQLEMGLRSIKELAIDLDIPLVETLMDGVVEKNMFIDADVDEYGVSSIWNDRKNR